MLAPVLDPISSSEPQDVNIMVVATTINKGNNLDVMLFVFFILFYLSYATF